MRHKTFRRHLAERADAVLLVLALTVIGFVVVLAKL
jgi:hypothetical protein